MYSNQSLNILDEKKLSKGSVKCILKGLHFIYWLIFLTPQAHTYFIYNRKLKHTLRSLWISLFTRDKPSQRGTALSHTTFPSLRMQEMVWEPWVFTKPSSHRKEIELPSWRLSPKRFPFTGTPGSGHSLCRKAARKKKNVLIQPFLTRTRIFQQHFFLPFPSERSVQKH